MIMIVAAMAFCASFARGAATFNNETLRYVVTYKWGLIHKDAGDATLTLRRQGNHYNLRLVGSTRSWADKVYRVRDTLHSTLRVTDLKPVSYTKKMHEGKRHDIDKISFTHNGNTTIGKATRYRTKNGSPTVKETTLSATGRYMISCLFSIISANLTIHNSTSIRVTLPLHFQAARRSW